MREAQHAEAMWLREFFVSVARGCHPLHVANSTSPRLFIVQSDGVYMPRCPYCRGDGEVSTESAPIPMRCAACNGAKVENSNWSFG